MARTVDLSVPTWARRAVVGGFVVLLAFPVLDWGLQAIFADAGIAVGGSAGSAALLVSAIVCGVALLAWVWWARDADGESTWAAIPREQYEGRFAESGGIARGEQEDAIRELQDEDG